MFKKLGWIVVFLVPTALVAQSAKSAIGGDGTIWAGGEASDFNPDYGCSHNPVFTCSSDLIGATAFFDVNLTSKIGAEGEMRWLEWNGRAGEKESDYLLGPRYRLYRRGRYSLWAKAMFGGGWITTAGYPQQGSLKGSYYAYAPGGTVDYRLSYHLTLRADYEYQIWPGFVGPPTYNSSGMVMLHNHGLAPNGVSVGVSWRFFGR